MDKDFIFLNMREKDFNWKNFIKDSKIKHKNNFNEISSWDWEKLLINNKKLIPYYLSNVKNKDIRMLCNLLLDNYNKTLVNMYTSFNFWSNLNNEDWHYIKESNITIFNEISTYKMLSL